MNARLGVVVRSLARQSVLTEVPREVRYWGDERVDVGEVKYEFPSLPGVDFGVFPMRGFIRNHLPIELQGDDVEYVSMSGCGVDEYEDWVRICEWDEDGRHQFENGFLSFLELMGACAVILVPGNNRLEDFLVLDLPIDVIGLLRKNLMSIDEAGGFVGVIMI